MAATGGAAGAAGTSGTAGTAGTGGGIKLTGPAAYTALTSAEAPAGAPAPAAWTGGASCATCHGMNGEGSNLGIGPELRHAPNVYATWVVRHGREANGMAMFPETSADPLKPAISAADLTSVITWLGSLPKPTTGPGLYRDFCGNCHGPMMGTGGAVPVSVVGKLKTEVTMKVRMGVGTDPAMRDEYMPSFDATALTDAELDMIQTFLGSK